MKEIYISPSSQPNNTYAVGNTNEQEQCRKIAAALKEVLDRCQLPAVAGMDGTMYTRVEESNQLGAGLHMPIHTNGYDGTVAGLRIMVGAMGGEAEQIAKTIMESLAPITPGTSDGIHVMPDLYEINATKAICVYLEIGFHDNPEEAQWIIDHTEDIAVATAKALCNHYGVPYVADEKKVDHVKAPEENPFDEPVVEGKIYRVQVGAFYDRKYADALMVELKENGYDAFIV